MKKMEKADYSEDTARNLPSEEEMRLPPRRVIHSSDNTKATRIFHASLVLLLVLLTIGIIFWYQMHGE
jgi:hypothetical protein